MLRDVRLPQIFSGMCTFFLGVHIPFLFLGAQFAGGGLAAGCGSVAGCGLAGFGGAGVARVSLMGYSFFYLQKLELSLWMVLATKEAEEGVLLATL